MTLLPAAAALARTSSALVGEHDVPGFLVGLLRSCGEALGVGGGGVLLEVDGRLELLAASAHDAAHLELYQAQHQDGPCVEAHAAGHGVTATAQEAEARWPGFGALLEAAGYTSVHASPLHWQGQTIGAMGLFRASGAFDEDDTVVAQAFADLTTLLVTQTEGLQLRDHIERALGSRVVVEQAKGVISEQQGVSMADAYRILIETADTEERGLTETAVHVIRQAHGRP